jgi:hypothetical protein
MKDTISSVLKELEHLSKREYRLRVARDMLSMGLSVSFITSVTGVSKNTLLANKVIEE